MEKTIKPEAPVPAAENDDGSMTSTKALNVQIGQLHESLLNEAKANQGQIHMLGAMVDLQMVLEHVQMLTGLVIELSAGAITDDTVTTLLAERVRRNAAERNEAVRSRASSLQIASAIRANTPGGLRSVNGSGHRN